MTKRLNWERATARDKLAESPAHAQSIDKWWLTLSGRDDHCAMCATALKTGDVMVFNPGVRESICRPCAREAGFTTVPSARYLAMKAKAGL